jgi:hypothetical protein
MWQDVKTRIAYWNDVLHSEMCEAVQTFTWYLKILTVWTNAQFYYYAFSLLLSSYMFQLKWHDQQANFYSAKTYSNKVVLQCFHISNVQIIVKIYSVKHYTMLLIINCYKIWYSSLFTIAPCQSVSCSTNIYCLMIQTGPCPLTCMLCLVCLKWTTIN